MSAEPWLADWHNRHPGATSQAFSRGVPSTYDALAGLSKQGDTVLDLACGDGWLLERMVRRAVRRAVGIDLSAGELAVAKQRLGARVELVEGRAQALPFADACFDVVTCHMALMLLDPVEGAVKEVRRVLRNGGTFGVIVGAGWTGDAWNVLIQRLRPLPIAGPKFSSPETRTDVGLKTLLAGFRDVRVDALDVRLDGTPDEVWALFSQSYDAERLSAEDLATLEHESRAAWKPLLNSAGQLRCGFRARRAIAIR